MQNPNERFLEDCRNTVQVSNTLQSSEHSKEYVGFHPIPKFVQLGDCRVQLADIKYYYTNGHNNLRLYLYSMKHEDFLTITLTPPDMTSMVKKLDQLLMVSKLE